MSSVSNPKKPSNKRFFIALIPPLEVQQYATTLKEHFRDRYHSKAALRSPPHITLQPPFKWPEDQQPQLLAALEAFSPPTAQVPINLSGFGAFPPRVIYIDVEQSSELMTLQTALSQYVAETLDIVDPRSRDRKFCPHLTVAFRDLKPAAFRKAWPEFQHQEAEFTFTLKSFVLLIHTGDRWTIHHTFPLTAES